MKKGLINAARAALHSVGIAAVRAESMQSLLQKARAFDTWNPQRDSQLMSRLTDQQATAFLEVVKKSRSQLRQDMFVLSELNFKRNGFFVEFGATNGVDLSNTYLLEKEFQWRGILAEPARCWQSALRKNRSAAIETRCVWSTSDTLLKFKEVSLPELSTIDFLSSADLHGEKRRSGRTYDVETISLNDLLEAHDAPPVMDYLSIDTEGSELEILRSFDFSRYSFSIITCEHNYTSQREQICSLLMLHGYVRKHQDLSAFDDWYVKANETPTLGHST
ncbi:MAG TPA: FkbM family methyltransferase [Candidatus Paceibacterota bacterium]|nr:FkbM family methyltransferase [Candidatus Paceibacterota bacterium]